MKKQARDKLIAQLHIYPFNENSKEYINYINNYQDDAQLLKILSNTPYNKNEMEEFINYLEKKLEEKSKDWNKIYNFSHVDLALRINEIGKIINKLTKSNKRINSKIFVKQSESNQKAINRLKNVLEINLVTINIFKNELEEKKEKLFYNNKDKDQLIDLLWEVVELFSNLENYKKEYEIRKENGIFSDSQLPITIPVNSKETRLCVSESLESSLAFTYFQSGKINEFNEVNAKVTTYINKYSNYMKYMINTTCDDQQPSTSKDKVSKSSMSI